METVRDVTPCNAQQGQTMETVRDVTRRLLSVLTLKVPLGLSAFTPKVPLGLSVLTL